MRFDIEVHGRVRSVSIEPIGPAAVDSGRFRVMVDDVVEEIDVTRTDLGWSGRYADGRILDAAVTERPGHEWLIQLPTVSVTASADGRRGLRAQGAGVSLAGEQRVLSPMPGRIVRVLVQPGDEVELRQGLIVIEAMKMENELTSPKAGRVKAVSVTEGLSIEAGRLLVIVE